MRVLAAKRTIQGLCGVCAGFWVLGGVLAAPARASIVDQWEDVSPPLASGSAYQSLAVMGDYVFLGTDRGLYRSTDRGLTWTTLNEGLNNTSITALAVGWVYDALEGRYEITPASPVFVGTREGIYVGTAGGTAWIPAAAGSQGIVYDIEIDQFEATQGIIAHIYAASDEGVWRSEGGAAWILQNSGLGSSGVKKLASDFGTGTLYALTESGALYASGLFSATGINESWSLVRAGGSVNDVAMLNPLGQIYWLATDAGILKSDPSGNSWETKNDGLDALGVKTVESDYADSNIAYAAVPGYGIYRTTNEALRTPQWKYAQRNLADRNITQIKTNPADTLTVYSLGASGVYRLVLSGPYADLTTSPPTLDGTPPVVSAFAVRTPAASTTVSVTSFAATDNVRVAGYLITETSSTPSLEHSGWAAVPQTAYAVEESGVYVLYAWARDAAGNISPGLPAVARVDIAPPDAPTSLVAEAVSWNEIRLSWNASIDTMGSVTYEIFRNSPQARVATASVPYYADRNVSASSEYSYFVRAVDDLGNVSALSAEVRVATPPISDPSITTSTLTVAAEGTGGGMITGVLAGGGEAGIQCGADCSEIFLTGTIVTLSAAPSGSSTFEGWTVSPSSSIRDCAGTGICLVGLTRDTYVSAKFEKPFVVGVNRAPNANAGEDMALTFPIVEARLVGIANDDGLPNPPAALSYSWTAPAGVILSAPRSLETNAIFPGPGIYALVLAVADGEATSTDSIVVTVLADQTPPRLSGGVPSGTLAFATSTILSVTTDEPATCEIIFRVPPSLTSSSIPLMGTGGTAHSYLLLNVLPGDYIAEVRCIDSASNADAEPYVLSFSVARPDSDGDGIADIEDICPATSSTLGSSVNGQGCPRPLATRFDIKPDFGALDLQSSTRDFEIGIAAYGKIRFDDQPLELLYRAPDGSLGSLDFDSGLTIERQKVSLNLFYLPAFNRPATIELFGVTVTTPKFLRDGEVCGTCALISYASGTVIFSVPGFSTYEVVEGNLPQQSSSGGSGNNGGGGGGGGGGYYPPPAATSTSSSTSTFTAQITPTSSAASQLEESQSTASIILFTRPLEVGSRGEDVRRLQKFLNSRGFIIAASGPGSPGNETDLFGPATMQALIRFQEAYSAEILIPAGLAKGTGYFGPATIRKANALLGQAGGNSYVAPSASVMNISTTTIVGRSTPALTASAVPFGRPLELGSRGEDVRRLQMLLNSRGFLVATSGPGSTGQETTFFGPATMRALVRFQETYKAEILAPSGLAKGTGYFGLATMRKANALFETPARESTISLNAPAPAPASSSPNRNSASVLEQILNLMQRLEALRTRQQ